MKQLTIVRHATAVPGLEGGDDFSRRLRGKGRREADAMAAWFRSLERGADVFVSSPADRALETAIAFARALGRRKRDVRTDERLYDAAGAADVLAVVRELDDAFASAIVFGHNPAFTSFARAFVRGFDADLPKCGVVAATSSRRRWSTLRPGEARLDAFQYPKGLRAEHPESKEAT